MQDAVIVAVLYSLDKVVDAYAHIVFRRLVSAENSMQEVATSHIVKDETDMSLVLVQIVHSDDVRVV